MEAFTKMQVDGGDVERQPGHRERQHEGVQKDHQTRAGTSHPIWHVITVYLSPFW